MSSTLPTIPPDAARRLLLDAQGLTLDPARPATTTQLRKLIEQLGFVQIDSINIVERAHHLTLASRLDEYSPALLEHLLERDRALFEHWTHDASAIPTEFFPYWRHRFDRYKERVRSNAWWRERMGDNADGIIDHVRERIVREGPLQSRDFDHDRKGESGAWWGWKPQKAALEYLWRSGELAIARRVNFQKVYDLTERVLPEVYAAPAPEREGLIDWACRSAIERLGVATPTEIAAFWRAIDAADAKAWCERAAKQGEVMPVTVAAMDGMTPRRAFAVRDWADRLHHASEPPDRMRLLSPFDPVVRDRHRLKRLFGFDYRFEAFVPAPKRKFGYYVLPVLDGERFVGRVDPKFHRGEGWLEIRQVWWEPGRRGGRKRIRRLEDAVNRLALTIGAETWS